jgi:hydroxymethylpyrimidine/phosphomethylpyrimidine kinase
LSPSEIELIALTIAGSDSSGGAGIQADLRTFAAFGVHGASVITAVTAQNTKAIRAIHHIPADMVKAQMDAVFEGLDVAAVKIGMPGQRAAIEAIAAGLASRNPRFIVLDPVMIATSGAELLAKSDVGALLRLLVPLAHLVTPNLMEAAAMTGEATARDDDAVLRQAVAIQRMGARAVLIKGGHGFGPESVDVLAHPQGVVRFARPRIDTPGMRGTGCMLSSAIAANVAKGEALVDAIDAAKAYVTEKIAGSGRTANSLGSDGNDRLDQS